MDRDVAIGIDPHKTSWYAAVVDSRHQLLGELRVPASRAGYRELHRLARRWPGIRWAIEGSNGLGRPLTQRLIDDGITVVETWSNPVQLGHYYRTAEFPPLAELDIMAGTADLRLLHRTGGFGGSRALSVYGVGL